MPARAVLIFLAASLLLAASLGLGACGQRGQGGGGAAVLSPREEFFVQQYLRLVEARQLAAAGDSLADARFNQLANSFPADSLEGVAADISAKDPTRWPVIFEEIVRRKQIMESAPPRGG